MIKRLAVFSALTASLAAAGACGGGNGSPSAPTPTTPSISSISVTGYSGPFTSVGQTVSLKATANMTTGAPQDITNTATWTSDATGVATVSGTGVVTARSAGDATISATHQGMAGISRVSVSLPREAVPLITGGLEVTRSPEPAYLFRAKVTAFFSETGGTTGYSVNFLNVTWKDYQGQDLFFRNYTPGDLQRLWGTNFISPLGRNGIEVWVDYNRALSRATADVVISITDSLGSTRTFNAAFQDSVSVLVPQSAVSRSNPSAQFAGETARRN